MTLYCLVDADDELGRWTLHETACRSLDLGTLLGEGRITRVGDFDCPADALRAARVLCSRVVRCDDCCASGAEAQPDPRLLQRCAVRIPARNLP